MRKKIAIIDSGIGGTSLLKEIVDRGVDGDFFYHADSKNVPYGGRSQDFMLERMRLMIDNLPTVDGVLIACNTLTVETIDRLREEFKTPLFGIEPFIKYINQAIKGEKIGMILTPATSQSQRLRELVDRYDPNGAIKIIALKNLALHIENYHQLDWGKIEEELEPLKDYQFDKLILGCTHYPLIKEFIKSFLKVEVIDPNKAVIDHVMKSLGLIVGSPQIFAKFNLDEPWSSDLELPLFRELESYKNWSKERIGLHE